MRRLFIAALLGSLLASAQAQDDAVEQSAEHLAPPAAERVLASLETGIASWYGQRFHGRKTASGEAFDMNAFTAAHPKLPFGSWVRVHNPGNGRSVEVRINDRGPHIKRRVIDLSRAAAQALGLAGQGTRKVEITVVEKRR